MTTINQKGGIFVGKSHAQGGIDIVIPETGQQIEVEGNEPLIPREALQDATIRTYKGTNFDILNQINTSIGAKSINQKATTVHAGDVIICKKTLKDKTVKTLQGTNKQIVSAINENAGCNVIEPGAKMKTETGEVVQFKNGGKTKPPMETLLTDLYKDHHEAWDFMEKISSEVNENNCSECAKKIISLFHKELNHHFNEEENDFFPWVLQQDSNALNKIIIDELIEQHHWFISRIKIMEENPTPEKIKQFCNKLIHHIKLEEYLMNKFKQDPFKNTDMENQPTNNPKDTVTMNIPLLIRTLELAREDMETDAELHHMVERLIELKDKEVLTMDDYNFIEGVENNPKIKKYREGGETRNLSFPDTMPEEVREIIKGWDYVSKSPYSESYYNCKGKDWENTPDGCVRISDHWNFTTIKRERDFAGELMENYVSHANTDKPTNDNLYWTVGKYDKKSETYKVLEEYPFTEPYFSKIKAEKENLKNLQKANKEINEWRENLSDKNIGDIILRKDDHTYKITHTNPLHFEDEIYVYNGLIEEDRVSAKLLTPYGVSYRYLKKNIYPYEILKKHNIIPKNIADIIDSYDYFIEGQDRSYYTNIARIAMSLFRNSDTSKLIQKLKDKYDYLYDNNYDSHELEFNNYISTLADNEIAEILNLLIENDDDIISVNKKSLKNEINTKMANGGQLPTSNIKHQTYYDEFKVIFEDENGKPQEELHIYYSDALSSFNKHKQQNHYARLEGWNENNEFDVIFRTPRYKKDQKVVVDDKVMIVRKVNEFKDKQPSYNLISENGKSGRNNVAEYKISSFINHPKFSDGGEISEKEAFKKLMEPKTIEELKNSIEKIKKEYEEKKKSKDYQPYRDIPSYGTALYMAQSNFFDYIVSYNPEMLTPFLEAIQSVPKANRFKLNRIFESYPDEAVTRFLENIKDPLWKLIPASFRNVSKVNQLPFKPEPDNKHLTTITDLFVGKDGLRQTMTGVYFDTKNNKVVATNAHIMLIINAKPIIKEEAICYMSNTKSKHFKELEGNEKIISKTKDGCYQIEGTYPRYDAVVPTEFNEVITVNTYNLYKFCAITLKADLVSPITNQIFVRVNNEMEVGFNADFLAKSLKAMLFLGHDMVDLCFINKNKALVIVPKGKSREISYSGGINTDLVLVMPLRGLEYPEDNFFSYNLMDNCIYNHGKLESLGCVNINDDTEVASVKNGTTEFKKGDFVHKKNTNNKHYIVDAVNSNKLDLINTVSLKKLSGVNAVDYVLVKPEEVEDVEYAYDFYKRRKETEELKKKHPIVLEWTKGADIRNKTYTYLEELEKDLKSFGFTDRPTETYIKNKVWFKGYPYYIQIDLSKMDHDFNPEEEKLITWLKNYNKSFDFEQFSSEAEKKNKERAAEKKRLQQAQREKVEKQTLEAIQVLETLQNLTFEAEEKANIQKEIEALKEKNEISKLAKDFKNGGSTNQLVWEKKGYKQLEALTENYHFYIQKDADEYVLTYFDATEENDDDAFIDSISFDTIEEAKAEAESINNDVN